MRLIQKLGFVFGVYFLLFVFLFGIPLQITGIISYLIQSQILLHPGFEIAQQIGASQLSLDQLTDVQAAQASEVMRNILYSLPLIILILILSFSISQLFIVNILMHKKVSLQGWKKMIYVLLFLLLVVAPVMTLLLVVLALIVRIIPNSPLHSFLITTVVLFVVFITIVIITRIIAFTIATNSFQKGVVKTISTKVHWDIFMYAILFVPALFLIGQLNSIYIQGSLTYGLLVALLTTIQVLELHKIKK